MFALTVFGKLHCVSYFKQIFAGEKIGRVYVDNLILIVGRQVKIINMRQTKHQFHGLEVPKENVQRFNRGDTIFIFKHI